MDPALWQELRDEEAAPGREVEAIVRLREEPGVEPGGDPGGEHEVVPRTRLVARFGSIATCRVAAEAVRDVRRHPLVASLKAARTLGPEPAPVAGRAGPGPRRLLPSDLRRPAGSRLTGSGVVVGIVDWGLDVAHPAFRRQDGGTRVLALWDQRDASGEPPQPYGYGHVHDRAAIDEALAGASPYQTLGYLPADADRGGGSHGSHVAGIAAGSPCAGGPSGVAPAADLVFVHLADRGTGGLATLGDSVRLLEAVDFVRRVAGERPWVVNVSVGRCGGPHDGRTLIEMAFDELLSAAPGRFIVQSAGNYYRARTHATGVLASGETRTLTFRTRRGDPSLNELEIWYDGNDELAVRLTPPSCEPGPWVLLGSQVPVTAGGARVGWLYHRARDPNNCDHHVNAFLSASAPAGQWEVSLRADRVASGRYDAWLERDDRCPTCQARFTAVSTETTGTTGTIANGRVPIVVGAYEAHRPHAPVARFSSAGPTRDGRRKPDVLAPGVDVLSARSAPRGGGAGHDLFVRKSGTSMATPHVTGAVALCLEATGGRLSARQIRRLVLGAARPAPSVPAERAGAGYLDLPRLVAAAHRHPLAVRPPEPPEEAAMATQPDTDPVRRVAAAPAQAFREFQYRPEGETARWVDHHFEVVATPGSPVAARAGRGDVLLDVPLGRPGPGSLVRLPHRFAAPVRLGPGQLLLHPRTGEPDGDSPEADDAEGARAHVERARRAWRRLFGGSPRLRTVTIEDLSCAPSALIAASDFSAWTNSPTEVYVSDPGSVPAAYWDAVLYHESLHVQQFLDAGGRPPSTYTTMVRHECDAYSESARWVASRWPKDPHGIAAQMRTTAATLRREIRRTSAATADPGERNRRYRAFLLAQKLLPAHRTLAELYTRTPGRRPCAPAASPSRRLDRGEDVAAQEVAGDLWLPGAERLPHRRSGGLRYVGDVPWRLVVHTIEAEPSAAAFRQLARRHSTPPHLWAMPSADLLLQVVPLDRGSYALAHPAGTVETNRMRAVQVEVWGFARDMGTAGADVREWLAQRVLAPVARLVPLDLGTVRRTGGDECYGRRSPCRMSEQEWRDFGGVCGHQHVPNNAHWDPGRLDLPAVAARASATLAGETARQESVNLEEEPSDDAHVHDAPDVPDAAGGEDIEAAGESTRRSAAAQLTWVDLTLVPGGNGRDHLYYLASGPPGGGPSRFRLRVANTNSVHNLRNPTLKVRLRASTGGDRSEVVPLQGQGDRPWKVIRDTPAVEDETSRTLELYLDQETRWRTHDPDRPLRWLDVEYHWYEGGLGSYQAYWTSTSLGFYLVAPVEFLLRQRRLVEERPLDDRQQYGAYWRHLAAHSEPTPMQYTISTQTSQSQTATDQLSTTFSGTVTRGTERSEQVTATVETSASFGVDKMFSLGQKLGTSVSSGVRWSTSVAETFTRMASRTRAFTAGRVDQLQLSGTIPAAPRGGRQTLYAYPVVAVYDVPVVLYGGGNELGQATRRRTDRVPVAWLRGWNITTVPTRAR